MLDYKTLRRQEAHGLQDHVNMAAAKMYFPEKKRRLCKKKKKKKIWPNYSNDMPGAAVEIRNSMNSMNSMDSMPIVEYPQINGTGTECQGYTEFDSKAEILDLTTTNQQSIGGKRSNPDEETELLKHIESEAGLSYYSDHSDSAESFSPIPNLAGNNETNSVRKTRKKHEAVFSTFCGEEKNRVLYDKLAIGIRRCERKWGIGHGLLNNYLKTMQMFRNTEQKDAWIEAQKEKQEQRMKIINTTLAIQKLEQTMIKWGSDGISWLELSNLSYDRGIAVAAARYSINLFELEFLLQHLSQAQWKDMEKNYWYCLPLRNSKNRNEMSRLEIVKLSQEEGIQYASKKSGMDEGTIHRYRRFYDKYGADGLENYYSVTGKIVSKETGAGAGTGNSNPEYF